MILNFKAADEAYLPGSGFINVEIGNWFLLQVYLYSTFHFQSKLIVKNNKILFRAIRIYKQKKKYTFAHLQNVFAQW